MGNLLQAFERVYSKNNKAVLIVAGNITDDDSREMVSNYLAHPAIRFRLGFIEDSTVKYLFSASDYAVLPFKKILTSGSAVLSLTFSRPVIAPKDGILPEFITKNLGFLFNSYHEMEDIMMNIASGKQAITDDTDLLNFNGKYSWVNCVSDLRKIFTDQAV